jgi:hypothetical protein
MSGQPVMQSPPNQSVEIFLARLQAGAELCPPVDRAGQFPLRRLYSHLLATVTAVAFVRRAWRDAEDENDIQ